MRHIVSNPALVAHRGMPCQ